MYNHIRFAGTSAMLDMFCMYNREEIFYHDCFNEYCLCAIPSSSLSKHYHFPGQNEISMYIGAVGACISVNVVKFCDCRWAKSNVHPSAHMGVICSTARAP